MWTFEQLLVLTGLAALFVAVLAAAGLYVSLHRIARPRVGVVATSIALLAVSIVLAVSLHQAWTARREMNQRAWDARSEHLHRLQQLLRTEADALNVLAEEVRRGRYFTLVANDARKAIWKDEALSADVERHFPEYFHERERLIRAIFDHDRAIGHVRALVAATLPSAASEAYRQDLVGAMVRECGGIAPVRHDEDRCPDDLVRQSQDLFDRAADLADALSLASEAARRNAEETVLRGSCTYAPPE